MSDLEFVVTAGPALGQAFRFPSTQFQLGSAEDAGLRLEGASLEPKHADVELDAFGVVWLRDLSGRGTMVVNGEQLARGSVEPGGVVKFGALELRLQVVSTDSHPVPVPAYVPSDTAVSQNLKVGTRIEGRYEIVSKLAVGGMGEVYKARHVELDKPVVLKVMRLSMSNDHQLVARFKREAIAASRIGQQNIVDVSDFGRTPDGRFFFVMEYLDGVTLKHLLAQEGPQPLVRVTRLAMQIANALAAAHAQGVVHRDLKPDNLMVLQRPGQTDFIKVLDFGVAKVTPAPGEAGHTSFGMVMGTPQYMSPEQARAVTIDSRSDVYSLGLVIYELLVGKPTFAAETPSLLMVKHLTEAPPAFEPRLAAKLPASVEKLVMRMLAKDPAERPQTMAQVVTELDAIDVVARGAWAAAGATLIGAKSPVAEVPMPTAKLATAATPPVRASPAVEPEEPLVLPGRSRAPMYAGGVGLALVAVAVAYAFWPAPAAAPVVAPTTAAPVLTPPTAAPVLAPPTAPVLAPPTAAVAPVVTPPPPVTAPTPPRTVTVTLSSPQKAEVFDGDVLLGVTPLPIARPQGSSAELTFKAPGFKPLTRRVGFEADQAIALELVKAPATPAPAPAPRKTPPAAPATKPNPF